jgi:putative ABC transport system ATP-binding protein
MSMMDSPDHEVLLRFENVSRVYTDPHHDHKVRALQEVSFTVNRGEFIAIAGPSGSGKTTLLNLCAGLDQPTDGEVIFRGQSLALLDSQQLADLRLRYVGFIFQAYNLIPVLSAQENAEFVLLLRGIPARERKQRVAALLKEVGLEGMENRRPQQLSGGQQQRVAVARALASHPYLVLADEPTANLDSQTAMALLQTMEYMNRIHQCTFIFSTHDPRVMQRARRIVQMSDGSIQSDERRQPVPAPA